MSSGAVIDVQANLPGIGIVSGKTKHNRRVCSPELIDRLIVISYYKQVIFRKRQHLQNFILYFIDILKFIYQNIPEPGLPFFKNIRSGLKKLMAENQHIVEIDLAHFLSLLFIHLIDICKCSRTYGRFICLNIQPVIFYFSDFCQKISDKILFIFHFQLKIQFRQSQDLPQKSAALFPGQNICRSKSISPP